MSAYRKNIDENKYMSSLKKENQRFDSEPGYIGKYLKNKRKSYKPTQIFTIMKYQKKVRNAFVYPQEFLEEFKYVAKEKRMPEYITDNIAICSDDSGREDFMMNILIKKILMKKILIKEIKYKMCLVFIFLMFQMKKCYYN